MKQKNLRFNKYKIKRTRNNQKNILNEKQKKFLGLMNQNWNC